MQLLFIRHAEAEHEATSDAARELTGHGKETMLQMASALAKLCPGIELILTSPYVRAVQTSGILHSQSPKAEVRMLDELISEVDAEVSLKELKRASSGMSVVACVGHEPNISHLISLCLAGSARSFIHMGKASAALLEFPGSPMKGAGELRFLVSPKMFK